MSAPTRSHPGAAPPGVVAALALATFATIYLEIALMKLVSVTFYSSLVFAVIGVALLGYGAAGSLLAARIVDVGPDPTTRVGRWLTWYAALPVPTFLVINAIDVPGTMLFGSLAGLPILVVLLVLLSLPFVVCGLAVSALFETCARDANRLYFADLTGAGLGAIAGTIAVPILGAPGVLASGAMVAGLAAVVACHASGASRWPAAAVAAANAGLALTCLFTPPFDARIASDKHGPILSHGAKPGGLAITYSRWSTLGRVDVTEPFATLPPQFGGDISPAFGPLKIEQRMLMLDGAAPAFLYRVPTSPADMAFLAGTSQSPAYRLRREPSVLVIGMGGATDVLIALHHGARRVVAVELNAVSAHAVRVVYGDYVGGVLADPRVQPVVAEGRHFAAASSERFDIVQLSGVDTGAALNAYGLGTKPESYIYTVEAVADLLQRLAPGGVLSITRDQTFGWGLRLASVVRAALVAEGLDPGPRMVVLTGTGYGWATILVKREPFTTAERDALGEFAERYRFALAYDPLGSANDAFGQVVRAGATAHGEWDLRPSTDDWPFFFLSLRPRVALDFFDPRPTPVHVALRFLVATVAALGLLAVVLIGWPLRRLRTQGTLAGRRVPLVAYFAALGAAFMLVEIALIQRFTVFLGDPAFAVAIVLGILLVSSGLGSWVARRRASEPRLLVWSVLGIATALLVLASPIGEHVLRVLLGAPLATRLVVAALAIAAAGFPMGIPFPTGLARLSGGADGAVPWAWGINGMVSVVTSLGSYMLAMLVGHAALFVIAVALYGIALVASFRLKIPDADDQRPVVTARASA